MGTVTDTWFMSSIFVGVFYQHSVQLARLHAAASALTCGTAAEPSYHVHVDMRDPQRDLSRCVTLHAKLVGRGFALVLPSFAATTTSFCLF